MFHAVDGQFQIKRRNQLRAKHEAGKKERADYRNLLDVEKRSVRRRSDKCLARKKAAPAKAKVYNAEHVGKGVGLLLVNPSKLGYKRFKFATKHNREIQEKKKAQMEQKAKALTVTARDRSKQRLNAREIKARETMERKAVLVRVRQQNHSLLGDDSEMGDQQSMPVPAVIVQETALRQHGIRLNYRRLSMDLRLARSSKGRAYVLLNWVCAALFVGAVIAGVGFYALQLQR
eukprot:g2463.t1